MDAIWGMSIACVCLTIVACVAIRAQHGGEGEGGVRHRGQGMFAKMREFLPTAGEGLIAWTKRVGFARKTVAVDGSPDEHAREAMRSMDEEDASDAPDRDGSEVAVTIQEQEASKQ